MLRSSIARAMIAERFSTISADPPWPFPSGGLWDRRRSRASSHYRTLRLEEIARLPVADFATENCALWLWTPTHHLVRGIAARMLELWGFRIGSTLIWCKPQMGLGKYLRNAHEQALLGIRGSWDPDDRSQLSWFVAPRRKHSEKPEEGFEIFERLSPAPRLELFAREQREGWTCWGEQVGDPLGIGFDPGDW